MPNSLAPSPANQFYTRHIQLLLTSYQHLLQRPLLSSASVHNLAEQVFNGDFVLLSHNTATDPIFNYANRQALNLFALEWQELIVMPSRLSAETLERFERERLLTEVTNKGFIDNYTGVRIAKTGQRFLIKNAVVWNVYDQQQAYYGQAAYFKDWQFLP
jgi:hypothetical protein